MLGSVAEQVFRQASCLVLTVGPGSLEDSLVERKEPLRPFLFATDFSAASLRALPHATSFTNHFGAKLIVLHVLPAAPIPETFHWSKTGDLNQMRKEAQSASQKQFEELIAHNVPPATKLEFLVKFGIPGDQILEACHALTSKAIEQEAARRPEVQLLMTHPGVGPITALAFVLIIGTPERFHCGRQIASYLGVIPCEESLAAGTHYQARQCADAVLASGDGTNRGAL